MVINNIQFLLNGYLHHSTFETVVFVWVMDRQQTINDILSGLTGDYDFYNVSLIATASELKRHFEKDTQNGIREFNDLFGALRRLSMYQKINSIKISVTNSSLQESANHLIALLNAKPEKVIFMQKNSIHFQENKHEKIKLHC
ncbi:MAG: hypothetical protein LKJ64_00440 [Lentilactobacillus buchneri]|jgi:hypothetical protein|nr:hypothetical protein [Lentilactobacillus buchneri]